MDKVQARVVGVAVVFRAIHVNVVSGDVCLTVSHGGWKAALPICRWTARTQIGSGFRAHFTNAVAKRTMFRSGPAFSGVGPAVPSSTRSAPDLGSRRCNRPGGTDARPNPSATQATFRAALRFRFSPFRQQSKQLCVVSNQKGRTPITIARARDDIADGTCRSRHMSWWRWKLRWAPFARRQSGSVRKPPGHGAHRENAAFGKH